ncbi:MAG: hypothetical protein IT225_03005 [Flavobacteriales bacterium]|nr:hypothetical protein [Flavobacteriales bacterium]
MNRIGTALCTLALLVTAAVQAVPTVDITLVQLQAQRYEVRIRPDGDFNGFFASIVFTLRWNASSAGTLAEFEPTSDMMEVGIYPYISGEVVESNGFKYAPFVAFGSTSLAANGQAWVAGEEVSLGTIDVLDGPAELLLIEDDWTAANNADYYISLGGFPGTGVIYQSTSASITGANGALGPFHASLLDLPGNWLRLEAAQDLDMRYAVTDAAGRTIGQGSWKVPAGRSDHQLDPVPVSAGSYHIRLISDGTEQVLKTVLIR